MTQGRRKRLRDQLVEALKDEEMRKLGTVEWYRHFGISEDDVKWMERTKTICARHYPKRLPIDAYTNSFEPHIHSDYVQANMDIQAVGSTKLTLDYLLKYCCKPEPSRKDEASKNKGFPSTGSVNRENLSLSVR